MRKELSKMDELTFPVFGENPFLHFTFLLPKTESFAISITRAAVLGDWRKYKDQRSTLHGAIDIQPASGLLVEGAKIRRFSSNLTVEKCNHK